MFVRPLPIALAALVFVVLSTGAFAQRTNTRDYRTIDGSLNNILNPGWGAAGENLLLPANLGYADGYASPGGVNRPNPRVISNALFAQPGLINDKMELSDFCWVFGQFIDHDLSLTPDGSELLPITVPKGDPHFDPQGLGTVLIPMKRNVFDPATGGGAGNPRRHPNLLTAFIDGSMVYGSDQARADWLRSFQKGKLKVSAGNLLPYNTVNLQYDGAIDPSAPGMDNPVGRATRLFVAGDVRANENPLLASLHTLFVREHNRTCDRLARKHPDWTDEQLYQHARKIVGGIIQAIVYEEWLPTMGVKLPVYQGYRSDVSPQVSEVFTAAAFRLGHTLLNGTLRRIDTQGNIMDGGHLSLRDAFFNPEAVPQAGGIEPFLQGMATQTQQRFDHKVMDDVRNFLFGPPGAGGLDLVAINIQRGRERGLPDFNTVRRELGLQPYVLFQQISFVPETATALNSIYKNINNIDPWVGFLSESPVSGSLFGETLLTLLRRQFAALRDGDRFFFENDPVLSAEEKAEIRAARFHDVVMRNTVVKVMQDHLFEAMPYSLICDNMTAITNGQIFTAAGISVPGVLVELQHGEETESIDSDEEGTFSFLPLPGCTSRALRLSLDDQMLNGVSTLDLILIQKHILDLEKFDSPYKIIAADVNNSRTVSMMDVVALRKIILGVSSGYYEGRTWRFIPAGYEFSDPENPFLDSFPDAGEFYNLYTDANLEYIAVKIADVNLSVFTDGGKTVVVGRSSIDLQLPDEVLVPGQEFQVDLSPVQTLSLLGWQFGLAFDPEALIVEKVEPLGIIGLSQEHLAVLNDKGRMATSWNTLEEVQIPAGQAVLRLHLRALSTGTLSQHLRLAPAPEAVAYDPAAQAQALALQFGPTGEPSSEPAAFALYQNQPNPFLRQTQIPFYMSEAGDAILEISDLSGRLILTRSGSFAAGKNYWEIRKEELSAQGVFQYKVRTNSGLAVRRMVAVE